MLLSAIESMGTMPHVSIQATNQGTGALGVFETAMRVLGDGRFGAEIPRLILAQNAPNTPLHDAWSRLTPKLLPRKDVSGKAPPISMLLSQTPAYDVRGGLQDALMASGGATVSVENEEVLAIDTESAVAVAALVQQLKTGQLDPKQSVLLAITGGGRWLLRHDQKPVRPTVAVTRSSSPASVLDALHLPASIVQPSRHGPSADEPHLVALPSR
jgi:cysteate synthase